MPIAPRSPAWIDSPSTVTPLSAANLGDLESRMGAYADKRGPEFAVDSYAGANDDAKVAAAITAANAVAGTVLFGNREYQCGTLWAFSGCVPLGSGGTR